MAELMPGYNPKYVTSTLLSATHELICRPGSPEGDLGKVHYFMRK